MGPVTVCSVGGLQVFENPSGPLYGAVKLDVLVRPSDGCPLCVKIQRRVEEKYLILLYNKNHFLAREYLSIPDEGGLFL